MIYPTLLLKHAKARRAIAGYPLYDIPNKREELMLDEARVQENFAYFMRVRLPIVPISEMAARTVWRQGNSERRRLARAQ